MEDGTEGKWGRIPRRRKRKEERRRIRGGSFYLEIDRFIFDRRNHIFLVKSVIQIIEK